MLSFLAEWFPNASAGELAASRRDLALALVAVQAAQSRVSSRPKLGDVRKSLLDLRSKLAAVTNAVEALDERTADLLAETVESISAGSTTVNNCPLNISPRSPGKGRVKQFWRACLDAQKWVEKASNTVSKDKVWNDKWAGDVADLEGFLWSVRPIWKRHCPDLPFNGSTKYPDARHFAATALQLVGLDPGPSAVRRSIIRIAKQIQQDEIDEQREQSS